MLDSSKEIVCALMGGALMAGASSMNLWLTGRLTGFSSILNSVLTVNKDVTSNFSAVTGIVTTCLVVHKFLGSAGYIQVPVWNEYLPFKLFDTRADAMLPSATCMLLGGVLVGFGTRLGNGCTSGHGVCGIPRLSKRSFTAVCVFMATGMATATTLAKRNFIPDLEIVQKMQSMFLWSPSHYRCEILLVMGAVMCVKWTQDQQQIKQSIVSFFTASLFSLGLMLSGMTQVTKILHFLTLDQDWNISLMFVMASAVSINLITFSRILKRSSPVLRSSSFNVPPSTAKVDKRLICGAVLFGAGWGISGACPAPVIALSVLTENGYFSLLSVAFGMYLHELFKKVEARLR